MKPRLGVSKDYIQCFSKKSLILSQWLDPGVVCLSSSFKPAAGPIHTVPCNYVTHQRLCEVNGKSRKILRWTKLQADKWSGECARKNARMNFKSVTCPIMIVALFPIRTRLPIQQTTAGMPTSACLDPFVLIANMSPRHHSYSWGIGWSTQPLFGISDVKSTSRLKSLPPWLGHHTFLELWPSQWNCRLFEYANRKPQHGGDLYIFEMAAGPFRFERLFELAQ